MKRPNSIHNLLLATTLVVGSAIGVGIFFQNANIISWSRGNATIVIISWIIGSIIALTTTLSYVEITRKSRRSNTGVGELVKSTVNKKMGWHTKMNWPNYYYSVLAFGISVFVANFAVALVLKARGVSSTSDYTWQTLVVGFGLFLAFLIFNVFASKAAELTQIYSTFLKAIPLVIISIGGLITIFLLSKYANWWTNSKASPLPPSSSATAHFHTFGIILFIMPAILFSFDGSMGVTSLTEDVKNRKHITFALIGGMSIITIIYILVTVAILNTGSLNAGDAMIKMFGGDPAHLSPTFKAIGIILQFFITAAGLGVINGATLAWTRTMTAIIKKPTKKKVFINMFLSSFVSFILPLISISLLVDYTQHGGKGIVGVGVINTIVMNTTIIAYSIYAFIIIGGIYKYYKNKNIDNNKHSYKKWFPYVSIVGVAGIALVVIYQVFYVFIYQTIENPTAIINGLYGWLYMVVAVLYTVWYIALPFILKRLFKNNYKNNF